MVLGSGGQGASPARRHGEGALVDLKAERAKLTGEQHRVEASVGPIVYLAAILGMDREQPCDCSSC
jgi:hypothetical protein